MASAVRLSTEVVEELRSEASAMNRSIAGQAEHWIKLGRAVEALPEMSTQRVKLALSGELPLEELSIDEHFELWTDIGSRPTEESVRSQMENRIRPGSVGLDDFGNMVKVAENGNIVKVDRF